METPMDTGPAERGPSSHQQPGSMRTPMETGSRQDERPPHQRPRIENPVKTGSGERRKRAHQLKREGMQMRREKRSSFWSRSTRAYYRRQPVRKAPERENSSGSLGNLVGTASSERLSSPPEQPRRVETPMEIIGSPGEGGTSSHQQPGSLGTAIARSRKGGTSLPQQPRVEIPMQMRSEEGATALHLQCGRWENPLERGSGEGETLSYQELTRVEIPADTRSAEGTTLYQEPGRGETPVEKGSGKGGTSSPQETGTVESSMDRKSGEGRALSPQQPRRVETPIEIRSREGGTSSHQPAEKVETPIEIESEKRPASDHPPDFIFGVPEGIATGEGRTSSDELPGSAWKRVDKLTGRRIINGEERSTHVPPTGSISMDCGILSYHQPGTETKMETRSMEGPATVQTWAIDGNLEKAKAQKSVARHIQTVLERGEDLVKDLMSVNLMSNDVEVARELGALLEEHRKRKYRLLLLCLLRIARTCTSSTG